LKGRQTDTEEEEKDMSNAVSIDIVFGDEA